MRSPRANKKLTGHELACFLAYLAETGNFALACEKLGRAKSGLYKRRIRDSLFDSECVAALALSHRAQASDCAAIGSQREEMAKAGRPPAEGRVDRRHAIHSRDGSASPVVLTTYRGRPQLRRAAPGAMARGGIETFLRTLAATGNVRFAAASVGVAHSSIYARARRDPAFAAEMDAALDVALASLEMNLIEATGTFLDSPSPLAGEGESAELTGERGPFEDYPFATRMTVDQAINLVGRLQRKLERGL